MCVPLTVLLFISYFPFSCLGSLARIINTMIKMMDLDTMQHHVGNRSFEFFVNEAAWSMIKNGNNKTFDVSFAIIIGT